MSLASAGLIFTHRALIERQTGTTDEWANPDGDPEWATHIADQPCRVWESAGREVVDATTTVVVDDARMLVPLGTDVATGDRISTAGVTYRGTTILAGPIRIHAVLERRDHLELVLVKVA